MKKIVLVTGGSSGIGKAVASILVNKDCVVYEISRHGKDDNGITHLTADVTNETAVLNAINQIISKEGKIDILINCAGFGISGAIEFTEITDAKAQFDVNFFGMVNVNKAVLPHMRNAKSGKIITISSLAAAAHIPFQAFYSASKAAIDSYTSALANEVRQFGIKVTAIQAGDIKSGFTSARKKTVAGDDIYNGKINKSVHKMENDESNGMSAEIAAKLISKIVFKKNLKPLYVIGFGNKVLYILTKYLPCRTRNFIVGKMYAK